MAQLVIAQGVLVRLVWQRSGVDHAVNVLGALNPSAVAVNQALANTVGAAIKSGFTTSGFVGAVGTAYALAQVTLRDISQANRAEFPDSGAAVAGTETTHLLPPQIALVITLRTALAGPSYRGRIYLGGFTEATSEATGTASAATGTISLAFVTAIQSALSASGLTMAVLSRPQDAQVAPLPVKPAKAGWGTAVTSIVNRNLIWDTQRRRATAGI